MKKIIALSIINTMALTGLSYSEDNSVSADFSLSYDSNYVFRGLDLGEDLYSYAFNVAGTGGGLDWSAGAWYGNWDAGQTNGVANSDEELDLFAAVSKDLGFGAVELGVTRFIFPDDNDAGNTEFYAKYSTSVQGIDLSGAIYWNAAADSFSVTSPGDLYYELSSSYSHQISDQLSADLSTNIGFFNFEQASGFAQITVRLGLSYAVNENISINPHLSYAFADEDYAASTTDDDTFFGGVSIGYNF